MINDEEFGNSMEGIILGANFGDEEKHRLPIKQGMSKGTQHTY